MSTHDSVRIFLVLGDRSWTWTPVMPRWRAIDACRDFGEGFEWDGLAVKRALIVPVPEETHGNHPRP